MIKRFKERYPHIQVKLREAGSDFLRKEAADGKFDFAVVNLPADGALFDITPLEADRLALVVPENFSSLVNAENNVLDFADCKDLPFIVATPSQEMRKLFENLCTTSDCRPEITAEVTNLVSAWELALAGVGATMLPLQFVNAFLSEGKVSVFELNDTADLRRPAILTLKGQHISKPIQYAIELLTKK
jgi:DNA-binding transcriptional LysR family regulator